MHNLDMCEAQPAQHYQLSLWLGFKASEVMAPLAYF